MYFLFLLICSFESKGYFSHAFLLFLIIKKVRVHPLRFNYIFHKIYYLYNPSFYHRELPVKIELDKDGAFFTKNLALICFNI